MPLRLLLPFPRPAVSVVLLTVWAVALQLQQQLQQQQQQQHSRTPNIFVSAWTAEWIDLRLDASASIVPPRSGHAAFVLGTKTYVFGGYAEDPETSERYPTNDLWCFDSESESDNQNDSDNGARWTKIRAASPSEPQPRLAAAAVACRIRADKDGDGDAEATATVGLLLGGWDSQKAGTGGVILRDVHAFSSSPDGGGGGWKPLPADLRQPTSRLCAVPLGNGDDNGSKVLIHNHRCIDHVLVLDASTSELTEQPVTGTAPSARGLHACARLPGTPKMVLFGGAAQSGAMSNEVFVLDTERWVWEEPVARSTESGGEGPPCPRASPCLVALDSSTCLLFGGAAPSAETGLHGLNDVWLLELRDGDENDGASCTWTKLSPDGSESAPPGRNAATLLPLHSKPAMLGSKDDDDDDDDSDAESLYFLLTGGWYPFRTTYGDNYVLKVTNDNNDK